MENTKITRPEQIANDLGISGKIVRAYLRRTYTRPSDAKGSAWSLSAKQVSETLDHFRAKNAPEA
jgi:hypothetical protein